MNTPTPSELQEKMRALEAVVRQHEADQARLYRLLSGLKMLEAPEERGLERLFQFLKYSSNMFYAHTVDHMITYVSPQSLDVLGYTPTEMKRQWPELASDNPINEKGYRTTCLAIATGVPQPPYELELIHKSGQIVHVEVHETPIVKDGKVVEIVGSLTDITFRKRAEESIRYHLTLEKAVTRASRLFITPDVVDIDQVLATLGQAVGVDRAYLFRSDSARGTMSNTHEWCAEGVAPEIDNLQDIPSGSLPWWMERIEKRESIVLRSLGDLPAEAIAEREILEAQQIQSLAVVPVVLHDATVWGFMGFDDTKAPRNWSDNDVGILEVVSDMVARYMDRERSDAERKQLEKRLFHAQKMESIGRLAGGVAHDFNNTLTGIMGYAELLKMKHSDTTSLEGEAADVILQGAQRAENVTKQLLGFARGGKYMPVSVDMNEMIADNSKLMKSSFPATIDYRLDLAPSLPPVLADSDQMERVLTNLLVNARDAMPRGGVLTVKSELAAPSSLQDSAGASSDVGEFVKVSVIDTGVGIPDELHQDVFEPFFTTKSKRGGVGLGLASVHGVVGNHSGHVELSSKLGEGTCVSIFLPVTSAPVARQVREASSDASPGRRSETVMLVDDDEDVRSVLKLQLERLGCRVLVAASGKEALLLYADLHEEIDLILLDVLMPAMDGLETFKELKAIDPGVRAIAMSGYSREGKAADLMKIGACAFMQKPLQIRKISSAIASVLD